MSENIRKIYRKGGVLSQMPKGKGEHTEEFHSCVVEYLKKGMSYKEAAKRCMGGLGRNVAVKKSHWSKDYAGR